MELLTKLFIGKDHNKNYELSVNCKKTKTSQICRLISFVSYQFLIEVSFIRSHLQSFSVVVSALIPQSQISP